MDDCSFAGDHHQATEAVDSCFLAADAVQDGDVGTSTSSSSSSSSCVADAPREAGPGVEAARPAADADDRPSDLDEFPTTSALLRELQRLSDGLSLRLPVETPGFEPAVGGASLPSASLTAPAMNEASGEHHQRCSAPAISSRAALEGVSCAELPSSPSSPAKSAAQERQRWRPAAVPASVDQASAFVSPRAAASSGSLGGYARSANAPAAMSPGGGAAESSARASAEASPNAALLGPETASRSASPPSVRDVEAAEVRPELSAIATSPRVASATASTPRGEVRAESPPPSVRGTLTADALANASSPLPSARVASATSATRDVAARAEPPPPSVRNASATSVTRDVTSRFESPPPSVRDASATSVTPAAALRSRLGSQTPTSSAPGSPESAGGAGVTGDSRRPASDAAASPDVCLLRTPCRPPSSLADIASVATASTSATAPCSGHGLEFGRNFEEEAPVFVDIGISSSPSSPSCSSRLSSATFAREATDRFVGAATSAAEAQAGASSAVAGCASAGARPFAPPGRFAAGEPRNVAAAIAAASSEDPAVAEGIRAACAALREEMIKEKRDAADLQAKMRRELRDLKASRSALKRQKAPLEAELRAAQAALDAQVAEAAPAEASLRASLEAVKTAAASLKIQVSEAPRQLQRRLTALASSAADEGREQATLAAKLSAVTASQAAVRATLESERQETWRVAAQLAASAPETAGASAASLGAAASAAAAAGAFASPAVVEAAATATAATTAGPCLPPCAKSLSWHPETAAPYITPKLPTSPPAIGGGGCVARARSAQLDEELASCELELSQLQASSAPSPAGARRQAYLALSRRLEVLCEDALEGGCGRDVPGAMDIFARASEAIDRLALAIQHDAEDTSAGFADAASDPQDASRSEALDRSEEVHLEEVSAEAAALEARCFDGKATLERLESEIASLRRHQQISQDEVVGLRALLEHERLVRRTHLEALAAAGASLRRLKAGVRLEEEDEEASAPAVAGVSEPLSASAVAFAARKRAAEKELRALRKQFRHERRELVTLHNALETSHRRRRGCCLRRR
eukprot:TRINITY_DN5217_c0_g1_i5.p1 TRINITY_DN5217_c0_g1~~TRINITY_DN5217_c0_g1_i5.p1  ORF type:complete len:1091 (+),score=269.59 TRINITY_DN5217_c0_g1_i5:106-3273(+)